MVDKGYTPVPLAKGGYSDTRLAGEEIEVISWQNKIVSTLLVGGTNKYHLERTQYTHIRCRPFIGFVFLWVFGTLVDGNWRGTKKMNPTFFSLSFLDINKRKLTRALLLVPQYRTNFNQSTPCSGR